MRTGIATIPLDYGKCPRWLFERMRRLGRAITVAIVEEFGPEEFLRRLSDPIWFQSLGCVLGFDWNSSGLGVTTLGALKAGLFDIQDQLGIYVCGGKRESKKTPEEIMAYGISRGFEFAPNLIYASKIVAKVDSALVQDGFTLYHHNFIFTKSGSWAVVQQGMNATFQRARRYHWFSQNVKDFTREPHSGIISDFKTKVLNLVAKESEENKKISLELVKEEPKTFLRDYRLIFEKKDSLMKQKRLPGFCEIELEEREFYWHPVLREHFDFKRLKKTIEKAHFLKPENFENLIMIEGVGPKTIRALSLVSEIIYGAKPSFEDPARYSFAHGGKDKVPYPVDRENYDRTIRILEMAVKKAKISNKEKVEAQKRLIKIRI